MRKENFSKVAAGCRWNNELYRFSPTARRQQQSIKVIWSEYVLQQHVQVDFHVPKKAIVSIFECSRIADFATHPPPLFATISQKIWETQRIYFTEFLVQMRTHSIRNVCEEQQVRWFNLERSFHFSAPPDVSSRIFYRPLLPIIKSLLCIFVSFMAALPELSSCPLKNGNQFRRFGRNCWTIRTTFQRQIHQNSNVQMA